MQNLKNTKGRKAKRFYRPADWSSFQRVRNEQKSIICSNYRRYVVNLGNLAPKIPNVFDRISVARLRLSAYQRLSRMEKVRYVIRYLIKNSSNCQKIKTMQLYQRSIIITDNNLSGIVLTCNQVFSVLRDLDPNKACGPDDLPLRVLKECCLELAPSLTTVQLELAIWQDTKAMKAS